MNLIVGATGILGSEICRLLADKGEPVRALVRATSNPEKVAQLKALNADVAVGDLKDRRSLDAACRGVRAIISTASSTLSRQEGDSIESVDQAGQLNLVDAAEAAGVKHFVLISFPNVDIDFPLQRAKRAVEGRLQRGGMSLHDPAADVLHGSVAESRSRFRPEERQGADLREWEPQDQLDLFPGRGEVCSRGAGSPPGAERDHQAGRSRGFRVHSRPCGWRNRSSASRSRFSTCPKKPCARSTARQPTRCSSRSQD